MFEDYLKDASEFSSMAKRAEEKGNEEEAKRFYRSAVFCSESAIEAFVNFIADSFSKGENLPEHELAFILDKKISFSPRKLTTETTIEYHSIESKLKFLAKKFSKSFLFDTSIWSNFIEFKRFRDSLIHPHHQEDQTTIKEYKKKVRDGMTSIIDIMDSLNQNIFNRHLRKKLLDLRPD